MKDRILRLLRKNKAKEYYTVWAKGTGTYNIPIKRVGDYQEWNYYYWAGIAIHHNYETDKITIFCDNHKWEE